MQDSQTWKAIASISRRQRTSRPIIVESPFQGLQLVSESQAHNIGDRERLARDFAELKPENGHVHQCATRVIESHGLLCHYLKHPKCRFFEAGVSRDFLVGEGGGGSRSKVMWWGALMWAKSLHTMNFVLLTFFLEILAVLAGKVWGCCGHFFKAMIEEMLKLHSP